MFLYHIYCFKQSVLYLFCVQMQNLINWAYLPSLSLQNDFLSIHGFCSGRTIFPCSHRVQDPVPTPAWCSHRSNDQIVSIFVFLPSAISICLFIGKFLYSSLRTCFYLSILGSLCMPKIISTILKKIFLIIKGETTLVCLPAKPLCALVLSLALTSLFVHKSIFVLTFRKELPNLSFCKFLVLFHKCYYRYC